MALSLEEGLILCLHAATNNADSTFNGGHKVMMVIVNNCSHGSKNKHTGSMEEVGNRKKREEQKKKEKQRGDE